MNSPTTPLFPTEPTISSEELFDRLDDLETRSKIPVSSDLLDDEQDDEEFAQPDLSPAELEELDQLSALAEQLRFRRGDDDNFTLVNANHLESWARDYASGFNLNLTMWPLTAIDWHLAADQLATTHSRVDFSTQTFYVF